MKRLLLTLALLLVGGAKLDAQTVNLTGHLKSGNTSNVTTNAFLRFRLRNYSGNTPRVIGTGDVVQTQFDVKPDLTGTVTTTIYANDFISPVNTFWTVETWYNGVFQFSYNYGICAVTQVTYCASAGANFNLDSASPISFPTPPAPYLPLPGPQGPAGPQGATGPQGPPGAGGSGPQLQTNNSSNSSQTLLNQKNGSNISITSDGSGGVTFNAVPGTPAGCVQYNSSSTFVGASGICTPDGSNLHIAGPAPFVDITAAPFNARPSPFTNSLGPNTTATCTATQNTCTFGANVVFFQVNDGVTIRGAGATLTISTPSAPTVTPSLSAGGTGLGGGNYSSLTTVASGTGSSTYSYELIARDKVGGYTAPSTAATITNGLASLGAATCTISSMSRSGVLVTINFSSSCAGAVQGAAISVQGATSSTFTGFYTIKTVNSGTQIIVSGPYNSNSFGYQQGDSTANSATGGTATFFLSNHLSWTLGSGVWQYYVCGKRPGDSSYNLIGVTKPSTSVSQDVQFDDYGSPYNDNQTYPLYITNSLCNGGSAQNDPLTTTITNISGSTVTLAANASNNTSSTLTLFDDAPGILAAMNTVAAGGHQGRILIPWTALQHWFIVNSYLVVPSQLTIEQNGTLVANETIEFDGDDTWKGSLANSGTPQFAYSSTGSAALNTGAVPGIYSSGDGLFIQDLTITDISQNGGLLELDEAAHVTRNNVQYVVSSSNIDYLGMGIVYRNSPGANDASVDAKRLTFLVGTGASSWTPLFYATPAGGGGGQYARIRFEGVSMNQRGFIEYGSNGGSDWSFENATRQGGIVPFLWLLGNGHQVHNVWARDITLDTDDTGLVSNGVPSDWLNITLNNTAASSADAGGFVSPITGYAPTNLMHFRTNASDNVLPNATGFGTCGQNTAIATTELCDFNAMLFAGPNGYIYWPLAAPTGLTASAAAGGSLASGTFQVAVTAVGIDGNETVPTPNSSNVTTSGTCTGSGNCEISMSWSVVPYALSYNVYACGPGASSACPSLTRQTTGITGTSYTLTSVSATTAIPPNITLSGKSGHNTTTVWAPQIADVEGTAPSGVSSVDQFYADSTAHRWKMINNNEATPEAISGFTASLTNNDCVFWSGTSGLQGDAGGKCAKYTITPTNGDCVTWSGTGGLLGDSGSACGAGGGGLNTNMNNMASPTALSQSLTPGAVNSIAAGSQLLPFTNIFLGTVANQAGSFDTSALTANHVIKFPNADSTAVQNCASASHQFLTQILQSTGACSQAQPTLTDIAAGASPAGLFNFSASTMQIPQAAAFTSAANSTLGLDTTNNRVHAWINSADAVLAGFATPPAGTKCAQTTGTTGLLVEASAACGTTTPSSSDTFTNKTENVEGTGNVFSEPVRMYFASAGCNNSTPGTGWDIGVANGPTPQCVGSTARKGVLQYARGNVAYINAHLPSDWNSGASTDIEIGFTTTDTTNAHVTSFNVQTACNKVDGTATDDPAFNASQALSITTGASQTSGGELTGKLTGITMTGCSPDYNFEILVQRNNSGTDTNSDTAVAVKFAEIITGVTKNSTNR